MPAQRTWSRIEASQIDVHDDASDRIRQVASVAVFALVALLVVVWPRDRAPLPAPRRFTAENARPLVEAMIESKRCDLLARPEYAELERPLRTFYEGRNWTLAWTTRRGASRHAVEVASLLSGAAREGLDPADYDARIWHRHLDTARSASLETRARLDIALTVAAMRFARDLHGGRVDPGEVEPDLASSRQPLDLAAFAGTLCASNKPAAVFETLEPPNIEYRRLCVALARYRSMAERAGDLTVEETSTVDPGSEYADEARLAALLEFLGDLPPREGAPLKPARYEGAIVDAVKRFQQRHGLDPDGRIGASTFRALNTPLSARVRQIELTLERWRRAPRDVDGPKVVVNIPEYRLACLDREGRTDVSMRVVVGEAEETPTPFVSGELEQVVFRPQWNVPESIQTEEILPELDADYLAKHDMEIVDASGRSVALSDAALTALREKRLHLRQRPGPKNALGPVKFHFPNHEAIYLHGTPAQALFQRARRDFSHGCIRVEEPETLAAWILRDQPEWTRSRIRRALAGRETQSVNVRQPTPVVVTYHTAVVTESGEVRFFDDVYGLDAALDTALARARWSSEQTARNQRSGRDGDHSEARI